MRGGRGLLGTWGETAEGGTGKGGVAGDLKRRNGKGEEMQGSYRKGIEGVSKEPVGGRVCERQSEGNRQGWMVGVGRRRAGKVDG